MVKTYSYLLPLDGAWASIWQNSHQVLHLAIFHYLETDIEQFNMSGGKGK